MQDIGRGRDEIGLCVLSSAWYMVGTQKIYAREMGGGIFEQAWLMP